ncbi:TrbI/VirB10 family protein [Massilia sp. R2A-15]|uniref:TrbI/VirB10 family protein n=1 Tax=Massilia sp. R2A-15 TaxID=3064278 RepID=UPI00273583CC|nr:TrbI/VirB10 family protein [Massilia sp. R2A-15]WLI87819.1 TrbI/VirB10 family protein [Massilia sp. R2A-15]
MFLNKRRPPVSEHDRNGLQEAAAVGATPGQKMIGVFTAVAGSAVLLGGLYFKVVRSNGPVLPATSSATPSAAPTLHVPLDLTPVAPPASPQVGLAQSPPNLPPGMPPESAMAQGQVPLQGDAGGGAHASAPVNPERQAAIARRLSGGFGSVDAAAPDAAAAANAPAVPMSDRPVAPAAGADLSGQTGLSGLLVGTTTPPASAARIGHQHMTLLKGTSITCSLDTAIQTDQMGFTSCLTDYPVYSMDGKVVLLERGTKVDGEYTRAVARGVTAIFVLWTRAVTPTGVVVNLVSPGTDPLGRAGLAGKVDAKFWDRYGGALMFSVLQDGIAVSTARGSGGNTQINLGNTQATGVTAAGEILKQNGDIMPSMSMPHGARVGITAARDLDFSGVYALETVGQR